MKKSVGARGCHTDIISGANFLRSQKCQCKHTRERTITFPFRGAFLCEECTAVPVVSHSTNNTCIESFDVENTEVIQVSQQALLSYTMRAFHFALFMIVLIASEAQQDNFLPRGLHPDIQYDIPVKGTNPGGMAWANSYSVGDQCYCLSELKSGIDKYPIETPLGWMTVKDACAMLGQGPGVVGNPVYNDVQCGNGPPGNETNENICPGRVDVGRRGCGQIGPKWNFGAISLLPKPSPPATFFRDCGTNNEDTSVISGKTSVYKASSTVAITGTSQPDIFRSHRMGLDFAYLVQGLVRNQLYTVSLGFAEIWKPNCQTGKRVQSVQINGIIANAQLDVFKEAGCATAYVKSYNVPANGLGTIQIRLRAIQQNAMLSMIKIVPATSSSPPPTPKPVVINAPGQYFLDTGAIGDSTQMVQGVTTRFGDPKTPEIAGTTTPIRFRTHRFGSDFKYVIESGFTPGRAYKISLGFSEIYNKACSAGKRKFSIMINGQTVESGLDVAGTTGGCNKALVRSYTLNSNAQGKFEIAFKAILNNAMVSFIQIDRV